MGGLAGIFQLPDPAWETRWHRILLPTEVKERLLNYMLFSLLHRGEMDQVGLPVHGLAVLAGPPGTGKTTLAAGLANQAARVLKNDVLFVDVDPHAMPSELLGESQRTVSRLFDRTLPDLASRGHPMVVLLDEAESLAVNRSRASLDTNPVDVHRATDAVLSGTDRIARTCPNITFIATTNYPEGVDPAFMSRADLIEQIGLPNESAIASILADTMSVLGGRTLPRDANLRTLARACAAKELDARQVRKLVLQAIASNRDFAMEPGSLTTSDLLAHFSKTT